MKTNEWVAVSQRFYRWLLHLYPQEYRTVYEVEMFNLFTDQYREANTQRGRLGVLFLWLRTLADVSISVVREHLSDSHARAGLLEAVPNAPLPWKGVLLVLVPGLIFFVSQIEQVTASNDWFFFAFYRAGYFLILPVLLVWLLTRRFPVWGLIPLGLLYETLWNYGNRFNPDNIPFLRDLSVEPYSLKFMLGISVYIILLGILVWHHVRRSQISRGAWKWLGLYGLFIVLGMAGEIYRLLDQWTLKELIQNFFLLPLWYPYQSLSFLLLVFVGLFFARKHGGLTFLLLLGYLLPTLVFGRYDPLQPVLPFYVVSLAVLVYRFIVALLAPIWLVRAASTRGRQRAAAIPVAIAIACHISLNLGASLVLNHQYGYSPSALDVALYMRDQLTVAVGLALAVVLYLPRQSYRAVVSPPASAMAVE